MANFVLVHGAWSAGYTWRTNAQDLRAAGHEVWTPSMTALGERSHLLRPGIDLDTHITDILNVIKFESLDDVILCGHSYGGMVVTGVADAIPEKIASLVYIDAFVPENGQALNDLVSAERRNVSADITVPPPSLSSWGLAPEKAKLVEGKRMPHPALCFSQKIKLTGGINKIKKRTYIYLNDPQPTSFTKFYEKFRNDPAWTMHTLPCTHLVQLDMPHELSKLLLGAIPWA